jgi:hypothetical protein
MWRYLWCACVTKERYVALRDHFLNLNLECCERVLNVDMFEVFYMEQNSEEKSNGSKGRRETFNKPKSSGNTDVEAAGLSVLGVPADLVENPAVVAVLDRNLCRLEDPITQRHQVEGMETDSRVEEKTKGIDVDKQSNGPPGESQVADYSKFQLAWMDSDKPQDRPDDPESEEPVVKKSRGDATERILALVSRSKKRGRPKKVKVQSFGMLPVQNTTSLPKKKSPGRPRKYPKVVVDQSSEGTATTIPTVSTAKEETNPPVKRKRGRPPKKKNTEMNTSSESIHVPPFVRRSDRSRKEANLGEVVSWDHLDNDSHEKEDPSPPVEQKNIVTIGQGETPVKRKRGRPPKNRSMGGLTSPQSKGLDGVGNSAQGQESTKGLPSASQGIGALCLSLAEFGIPVKQKRGRPPKPKPLEADSELAKLAHLCRNLKFLDKSFCGTSREWDPEDRVNLFKVVNSLPSTTPDFWNEVSKNFTKVKYSAQECQLEYQNCLLSYIYLTFHNKQ